MRKQEFLERLKVRLSSMSRRDVRGQIAFYSEMIDDRMEEGLSEEDAVAAIGSIESIVSQISEEKRLASPQKAKTAKGGLMWWELILIVLGSPIWGSLLLTFFVVVWSVNLALWAVELPFFIFSYVSKGLLIGCMWVTKASVTATTAIIDAIKAIFD